MNIGDNKLRSRVCRLPPSSCIEFGGTNARSESRIAGSFNGWRGGTIFELENGQVWQQSNPDVFVLPKAKTNPSVRLKASGFGGYWMSVEGCPKVRVKRVK